MLVEDDFAIKCGGMITPRFGVNLNNVWVKNEYILPFLVNF